MSVYVDPLFNTEWADKSKWPYAQACHMTADTHDELMEMAVRLGLKASWIQRKGEIFEHFDLTASKRIQAVRLGAREVTVREELDRRKAARTARTPS